MVDLCAYFAKRKDKFRLVQVLAGRSTHHILFNILVKLVEAVQVLRRPALCKAGAHHFPLAFLRFMRDNTLRHGLHRWSAGLKSSAAFHDLHALHRLICEALMRSARQPGLRIKNSTICPIASIKPPACPTMPDRDAP